MINRINDNDSDENAVRVCVILQNLFQFTLKCPAERLGMRLGTDIIRDLILIQG